MKFYATLSHIIFRLCLLIVAAFSGVVLFSLNTVYIICIAFLPPLASQLKNDGDNCVQRRVLQQFRMSNFENVNINHIQSIWLIFASEVPIIVFFLFHFFDLILAFPTYNDRKEFSNGKPKLEVARKQRTRQQLKMLEIVEGLYQLNSRQNGFCTSLQVFNTLFLHHFTMGFCTLTYELHFNIRKHGDGTQCLRLIDVVQLASLLVLSFYRGYTERLAKLQLKYSSDRSNNLTDSIGGRNYRNNMDHRRKKEEFQLKKCICRLFRFCYTLLIAFISDAINAAGSCVFLLCCFLKTVEQRLVTWPLTNQMLNNSHLFQALLAQYECACTPSAGCPLEHFVIAEFIFCLPLSYIWRVFRHWHRHTIEKRCVAAIAAICATRERRAFVNNRSHLK